MSGEMSEVFIETPTAGVDPQGRTVGGARETKGTSRDPVGYLNDIRAGLRELEGRRDAVRRLHPLLAAGGARDPGCEVTTSQPRSADKGR